MLNFIRRLAAAFSGCIALALAIPCFAQVSTDQIAVGGVGPGSTISYVTDVYGEPAAAKNIDADTGVQYIEYNYAGTFLVGFNAASRQAAYVTCTENWLATPDGVTTSMTADVLNKVYKQADHLYSYEENGTDKTLYEYEDAYGNRLSFDVQNFYIISINVRTAG